MIQDRRKHTRHPALLRCVLLLGRERRDVVCTDIGPGGAFLSGKPDSILVGTTASLEIRAPAQGSAQIVMTLEVIRLMAGSGQFPPGFAVRWKTAACDHGADPLLRFLAQVLHLTGLPLQSQLAIDRDAEFDVAGFLAGTNTRALSAARRSDTQLSRATSRSGVTGQLQVLPPNQRAPQPTGAAPQPSAEPLRASVRLSQPGDDSAPPPLPLNTARHMAVPPVEATERVHVPPRHFQSSRVPPPFPSAATQAVQQPRGHLSAATRPHQATRDQPETRSETTARHLLQAAAAAVLATDARPPVARSPTSPLAPAADVEPLRLPTSQRSSEFAVPSTRQSSTLHAAARPLPTSQPSGANAPSQIAASTVRDSASQRQDGFSAPRSSTSGSHLMVGLPPVERVTKPAATERTPGLGWTPPVFSAKGNLDPFGFGDDGSAAAGHAAQSQQDALPERQGVAPSDSAADSAVAARTPTHQPELTDGLSQSWPVYALAPGERRPVTLPDAPLLKALETRNFDMGAESTSVAAPGAPVTEHVGNAPAEVPERALAPVARQVKQETRGRIMLRVDHPVEYSHGDKLHVGRAVSIGAQAIAVVSTQETPQLDEWVVIHVPLTGVDGDFTIYLCGRLLQVATETEQGPRFVLHIERVEEGRNLGAFQRFLERLGA